MHSEIFGEQVQSRDSYKVHLLSMETEGAQISCKYCNLKFYKKDLGRHVRIHNDQLPYACEFCPLKFPMKWKLNKHMLRMHKDECFICHLCERKFSKKEKLDHHLRVHSGENPLACKICGLLTSTRYHLEEHERVHTGEKPFVCEVCDVRFTRKSRLSEHLRVHMGDSSSPTKRVDTHAPVSNLDCHSEICTDQVGSLDNYEAQSHLMQECDEASISQQKCKEILPMETPAPMIKLNSDEVPQLENLSNLNHCSDICSGQIGSRHNYEAQSQLMQECNERPISQLKHKEMSPMEYLETPAPIIKLNSEVPQLENFSNLNHCSDQVGSIESHEHLMQEEIAQFPCKYCQVTFDEKKDLSRHLRIHIYGDERFVCHLCKQKFGNKTIRDQHLRVHFVVKPFTCETCGLKVSTRYHLKEHERVHTGEKPFVCDVCDLRFTRKTRLKAHLRVHSGDNSLQTESVETPARAKPFVCTTCGQKESTRAHLREHEKTHFSKIYSCQFCDMTFSRQLALNVHLLTHKEERPYCCHICECKFRDKSMLTRHLFLHTSEKSFSSTVCDNNFVAEKNLVQHEILHESQQFNSSQCMSMSAKTVLPMELPFLLSIFDNYDL